MQLNNLKNIKKKSQKQYQKGFTIKKKLKKEIYPYMMYDSRKPFCTGLIFPVAWNKIFKREFLLKHYCKEEKIRMGEDNAFVFECIYEADNIYFCEDKLYFIINLMCHQWFIAMTKEDLTITNY